jgi:glycerol-3-phosphate acyltransferase PlsY
MKIFLAALAGYLLGSVSFSIILSRLRYRDDIRRHGSGNAGMTNTLRTYGKLPAVLVLAGDALKGVLAAWIGWKLGGTAGAYIAGLLAVVGHMFPLYFGFKGGKGVATAAGVILGTCPPVLLMLLVVFLLVVALSRYVSLGSVTVAVCYLPAMLWYTREAGFSLRPDLVCPLLMAALVIWAHRSNIRRLLSGTENKLGSGKGRSPGS